MPPILTPDHLPVTPLPISSLWLAVLYLRIAHAIGYELQGACRYCWADLAAAEGRCPLLAARVAGGGCG